MKDTLITTRYPLLPRDLNPAGNAFGGRILEWIDSTAAMCAQKYCAGNVVTASLDSIVFLCPIRPGEHVLLEAYVTYTGKSSMEIKVNVFREDPYHSKRALATTAYVSMISLDARETGKPVPPLAPSDENEKKEFSDAEKRMEQRKLLHSNLKNSCF